MNRRLVARRSSGSTFQRGFQFPDRRVARSPDRVERDAGARLAAMARHLMSCLLLKRVTPAGFGLEGIVSKTSGSGLSRGALDKLDQGKEPGVACDDAPQGSRFLILQWLDYCGWVTFLGLGIS